MNCTQPFGLARIAEACNIVRWKINNDKSVDSGSFAIAQKFLLSKCIVSDGLIVSHQHDWDIQTLAAG